MHKRSTWISLPSVFALSLSTGICMANTLPLLSASDLAGAWTLQRDGSSEQCTIDLSDTEVAAASGYALSGSSQCLQGLGDSAPSAWRPIPGGIALLDDDGSTLVLFAHDKDGYRTDRFGAEFQYLLQRQGR